MDSEKLNWTAIKQKTDGQINWPQSWDWELNAIPQIK